MSKRYSIASYTDIINSALLSYLEPRGDAAISQGEAKMREAMKYSVENGGKRIRPILTLEFCRLCKGDVSAALPFACAIEFIHSYSLIHDDLPCMDDDDMRRGRPSSHIRFGEANALLAGDALLTLAFETALSFDSADLRAVVKGGSLLARAAGCAGMVAGQVLDLENEGKSISAEELRNTDLLKTGELIRAACLLGCIAAGAGEKECAAAEKFAKNLGLAFQVVDDILDVTSSEAVLGKPIGSDEQSGKSTYVSLLGLDNAQRTAHALTKSAVEALDIFGSEAMFLIELSEKLLSRSN